MKPIFLVLVSTLLCASAVIGQKADAAKTYFTDTEVVDQTGKKHRLYSDLMEGKTVIVLPFHSDCTSVGPPMIATLRKVQEELAGRLAEFNILAVSVHTGREGDTPAKAKALVEKYKLGPNFYFLTGEKSKVDHVAYKFGIFVEDRNDHTSTLAVGNNKTGLWKKVYGLTSPANLVPEVTKILDDGKK